MYRPAFIMEVKWTPKQTVQIRGQSFRLHITFWNEIPGKVEVTDLTDHRPRELDVPLPDIFVVQRDDGNEVRLYRSWWGSHMRRLQDDPYVAPNGNPMVTYYNSILALRGDEDMDDPRAAQGFKTPLQALLYMQSVVPGYPAPPWMYTMQLFALYQPRDLRVYTAAEWTSVLKPTGYRTALIWAVTMAEARAIAETFNEACLEASPNIDWAVVSPQVMRIN